jgi:hypothetical protein
MGWPALPSRFDKAVSFTVDADREQADRWGEAAAERCMPIAPWLAHAADAHLRERARTGRATPLLWDRGRFLVRLTDTTRRPEIVADVEVRGFTSGPFGVFRGSGRGLGSPGCGEHSLAHLPTRRIIATLPLRKSCMALGAELAVLGIDWQETDPEKVLAGAPDQEKVQAVIRLYEKLTAST